MKYNPPPGGDLDAPYVDGNRNAGIKGSPVPASAVEFPQRELVHLIQFAGLAPDNADLEQVRKAIEALISAATGGGDTSQYLLVSQARARLPIFPEVLSADGKINIISPAAGSVQVPSPVLFQHRGIFPLSTGDYTEPNRTFATAANKTYHLRWDATNGFRLRDLADAAYNPTALAESDVTFDSTYDDMLVARVVTNSSNVPTITNLANKVRLASQLKGEFQTQQNPIWLPVPSSAATLNWARRPVLSEPSLQHVSSMGHPVNSGSWASGYGTLASLALRVQGTVTRYGASGLDYSFVDSTGANQGYAAYAWPFLAI